MNKIRLLVKLCVFILNIEVVHAYDFDVSASGRYFRLKISSLHEKQFQSIFKQKNDYSCGSAALATILSYYYNESFDDDYIFYYMYVNGNRESIRSNGFSMLDFKKFLESHGYRSGGFRVSLEQISKAGIPTIVLLNKDNYAHFVVVKKIDRNGVHISDSIAGNYVYSISKFRDQWNGVFFIISTNLEIAQKNVKNGMVDNYFNLGHVSRIALSSNEPIRFLPLSGQI